MIFEMQQEAFFHLATEGLPNEARIPCFPTFHPS
jgi:hypothetical protein